MKKILTLVLTGMIIASCTVNPDNRSTLIIQEKTLRNNPTIGKYKYMVYVTNSDDQWIEYHSDEDWNVGDTLKIVKK